MSLRYITSEPPNASVGMERMDGTPLRQSEMYMRNNFAIPEKAPTAFEIKLPGAPDRTVGIEALGAYQQMEITTVLECAGNGRILMTPIPDGTPWDLGGSSIITIRGVHLSDVLGVVPPQVREVVFTGADRGMVEPEGLVNYQFSVGRDLATSPTPILVTHIDGEPLTIAHGAPVRLVLPGHYAMKSVKWITRIEGVEASFNGHFVKKYRYYDDAREPEAQPVAEIKVRSMISSPLDGSHHQRGHIRICGSAWTGTGDVNLVELSIDEGPWLEASTTRSAGGLARWEISLELGKGNHTVAAKASDSRGNVQPLAASWNRNGFGNNVCHKIGFVVN